MKIAVLTTGGDAPGMNAALRAVVRRSISLGSEVLGVVGGFRGLAENSFLPLSRESVSGIINRGGTVLNTLRCPDFRARSYRDECYRNLASREIDGLVVIGGNGSQAGAREILAESNLSVAFIPASIDNDVPGTVETIGFDTAVNTILESIDRVRDTATSHERVFLVEVMGRQSGFLALAAGLADGAEMVMLPEAPGTAAEAAAILEEGRTRGKKSMIVVVAEGAASVEQLAGQIGALYPGEIRYSVLGYIQRGGSPSARSRRLALLFGARAVEALHEGRRGVMVGLEADRVVEHNLLEDLPPRKLDPEYLALVRNLG